MCSPATHQPPNHSPEGLFCQGPDPNRGQSRQSLPVTRDINPFKKGGFRRKIPKLELLAVRRVHGLVNRGYNEVVDGDLADYFGQIPSVELMRCFARRISDGRILKLLKAWLEMAVQEDDGKGGKRRTNRARRERKGTPHRGRRCHRWPATSLCGVSYWAGRRWAMPGGSGRRS